MTKRLIQTVALLILAALSLALPSCGGGPKPAAKPLAIATIFAYYDALRAIAGDDFQTEILLPPGTSPHEYDPRAKDKEFADDAKLIIKNGLGLDDWMDKLDSQNKTAIRLSIGDTVKAIQTHEVLLPGQEADPEDKALNPHIWLDPRNQIKAAEMIRDALIQIDPVHKAGFEQRAAAYIDILKKLDADFAATTKTFTHKQFIGFHSAYDYLAQRYGLEQVASLQEIGAGGLNPAQIERVEAMIKEKHIPVVFTESAFDSKQAQMVERDTGVKLGVLQPLETYESKNDTYDSLMRQNMAELKKAMQ